MSDIADAPEIFRHAVAALGGIRPRREVVVEELRAPRRLAPWSFALGAEAEGPASEQATGRLVLLHDPDGQQGWHGVLRVVAFVRVGVDAGLAGDPLLPEAGWSWLTEALETAGADTTALGGTVTRTSSSRFGEMAGPHRVDELELRASWTPDDDLAPHGEAFYLLMASVVGLPPVGVTTFPARSSG